MRPPEPAGIFRRRWFFGQDRAKAELSNEGTLKARYIPLYIFIIRFIAPVALAVIFLNGLGLIRIG